jgi:hypothetical protein
MLEVFKYLGTFQKGFCGNASPIEANASKALALHNRGFQSKLRCPNGGDIATGATSNYNEIILHIGGFLCRENSQKQGALFKLNGKIGSTRTKTRFYL